MIQAESGCLFVCFLKKHVQATYRKLSRTEFVGPPPPKSFYLGTAQYEMLRYLLGSLPAHFCEQEADLVC